LPTGKEELAVVHVEGQAKGFRVLFPSESAKDVKSVHHYVAWDKDGRRILIPVKTEQSRLVLQLHYFDFEGKKPPQLMKGQKTDRTNVSPAVSPDGKTTVFCSESLNGDVP
jgi:hypothetical protein